MRAASIGTGLIAPACLLLAAPAANTFAGGLDTYAGGAVVAWLPEEFVLGGAIPLGANFDFPGNPFVPVFNAGPFPLYDPATLTPTRFVMAAASNDNGDGSWSVSFEILTVDGSAFILPDTPMQVPTKCCGIQDVTDFVIDLGNGYDFPGFPVDGCDIEGDTDAEYLIDVEYYFERLDGTLNVEFGETTGPYLRPEGFCFAWGYAVADAVVMNRAGYIATFTPIVDPPPGCPPKCPDLDGDCVVGGADLSILLGAWGTPNPAADLTGDGTVGGADLSILLGGWGDCK